MSSVVFRPAAELELQEAYSWYEEREAGIGSDFIRCVDASLQLISRHPEIFPSLIKTFAKPLSGDFLTQFSICQIRKRSLLFRFSIHHAKLKDGIGTNPVNN